ncbi:MAG: CotH kinase family protein, partial [Planctomycetes bacterium]|nr:CotH kinase family protein [Planctomycetota bacterium]
PVNWGLGQPYSPGRPNRPAPPGNIGDLIINEIMYRPLRKERREAFDPVNAGFYYEEGDDELGEYIELHNRGAAAVDLSGWSFTDGIKYAIPPGTVLEPDAYLVIAANPEALRERHGLAAVLGPFEGKLDDGGERITLRDHLSRLANTVRYNDVYPWPASADEFGVSLECVNPLAENNSAANWRGSKGDFKPVPPPPPQGKNGWQFASASGVATSNRLYFYVNGPGEWLLDEVVVRSLTTPGGENLLPNGSFEGGDAGWTKTGNHSGSFWTSADAYEGTGSEHLVAAGAGDGSTNSFQILRIPDMAAGFECSISCWVKYLSGQETMTFRLSGGGLLTVIEAPKDYDLAGDWSEGGNPSGAWSYRDDAGSLITGRSSNWLAGDLGAGQPAWTNAGDGGVPGWCKSIGAAPAHDFPAGAVATHGPSEVWWTAPGNGSIAISGGLWLLRHIGRSQTWHISKNQAKLTSGNLVSGQLEFNSSNPLPFESGSGGAGALTFPVASGEAIKFGAWPSGDTAHDFVGFKIGIRFTPGGESVEVVVLPPPLGGFIGHGTPGRANSALSPNVPPFIDGLQHIPETPTSADQVTIIALVTDEDPITSVQLEYMIGTSTASTFLTMFDDGAHGDGAGGDGIYGAQIPPQPSNTLVHYRVHAADAGGGQTSFPYDGDPSTTQAYYQYDHDVNTQLTFYHLFITAENLAKLNADPRSDEYVDCSLAIDGIAYPHIGIRYRGRGSRTHPKHPWKMQFNKNRLYNGNRTLDTMLIIPFEQWIAFKVFDLAKIDNLEGDLIRMHMNGQFWGVYIAFESPTGSWLEKHGYHDGSEVYKARTVETPGQSKNSDLFHNQIVTDHDYWGTWNKKIRPLEPPVHIRELTDKLNDVADADLLPWLDAHVDLDQWFKRWALNILMNIDDFPGHNYYLLLPGEPGGKWKMLGYDFDSGFTFSRVGPLRALYGDGAGGDNPGWQRNKFYQRVSNNPTLKRIYFLTMRKLIDTLYRTDLLFPMIDELFPKTNADRPLEIAKWGTMRSNTSEMKNVITSQRSSMVNFLNAQNLPGPDYIPRCIPPGGIFSEPVTVTITAPAGWQAVFTVDGTDPRLSNSGMVYSVPILIESPTKLRVAAVSGGFASGNWTELAEHQYEVQETSLQVGPFIRGDCNGDGSVVGDLSDAVFLLIYLFANGREPPCLAACDANSDGGLAGVTDAIYLLTYNFLKGPAPQAPFPKCGFGTTARDFSFGCKTPLPCK